MAIEQNKRQTELEKRLHILRGQVYGKDQQTNYSTSKLINKPGSSMVSATSDLTYFYQDLQKILLLSSIAIGIQITLFILLQNHILKINLF